ncbi:MAG TPA: glycoside hydrolase family 2, partial [Ruminococcaceae bacterium]|nr:glycoside hydrolase family 2 [Oscillospiraceae bacterium]
LHAEAGKTPAALRFAVPQPKLWDTEHPNLYTLTARVEADGVCTDEAELSFGIRVFTVNAADGLRLNGEPIKLRGGCIHHDHGVLGAAAFPAAEERKAA